MSPTAPIRSASAERVWRLLSALSPTSLTFASQTVGAASAAQTITLSNSGNAALSVTSIAVSGANASDFAETNNCGSSVAAGANCTISVTFKPAAAGARTAAISVTDNATGSPQSVSLSGTGGSTTAAASVSPTSLSFGSEAVDMVSTSQVVTLSNTGSASLSISSIAFTGADAGDFTEVDTCSPAVAAGRHLHHRNLVYTRRQRDAHGCAEHRRQCQRQPTVRVAFGLRNARCDAVLDRQFDSWGYGL